MLDIFFQDKRIDVLLKEVSLLNYLINEVFKKEVIMATAIENLTLEVNEAKTAMQRAAVQLSALSAKIIELKNDPAALQVLADSLDSSSRELDSLLNSLETPVE